MSHFVHTRRRDLCEHSPSGECGDCYMHRLVAESPAIADLTARVTALESRAQADPCVECQSCPCNCVDNALRAHDDRLDELEGRIASMDKDSIVLVEAAWIASTGRFHQALATGVLDEVEPFPGTVAIGRGAVIDVTDWAHALPMVVK